MDQSNKWEYCKIDTFTVEEFNRLGELRWELVAIDRDAAWFKRSLPTGFTWLSGPVGPEAKISGA